MFGTSEIAMGAIKRLANTGVVDHASTRPIPLYFFFQSRGATLEKKLKKSPAIVATLNFPLATLCMKDSTVKQCLKGFSHSNSRETCRKYQIHLLEQAVVA